MIHAGTLAASLASPTATVNRDAVPRPPTAPTGESGGERNRTDRS
jgi:hypothetical protein